MNLLGLADRLASPIVVKELRQEIRGAAFTQSFFWLHIGLVVVFVLFLLMAGRNANALEGLSYIVYGMGCFPLIFVFPSRGFQSFAKELEGNTLELIRLSGVTTWQLTLGKWLTLVFEAILLLVSILPYTVLQHFGGGFNVLDQLVMSVIWVLASSVLIAVGVAIAAMSAADRRSPPGLISGLIVLIGGPALFQIAMMSRVGKFVDIESLPFLLISIVVLILFVLTSGSARIAQPGENFSRPRRICVLLSGVSALTYTVFGFTGALLPLLWTLFGLQALWAIFADMGEESSTALTLYRRALKGGVVSRITRIFSYPGWLSGIITSSLLVGIGATGLVLGSAGKYSFSSVQVTVFAIDAFALWLFPLGILRSLFPNVRAKFRITAIVILAEVLIPLILSVSFSAIGQGEFVSPPLGLLLAASYPSAGAARDVGISVVLLIVGVLLLILPMLREFKKLREREREVEES